MECLEYYYVFPLQNLSYPFTLDDNDEIIFRRSIYVRANH